jgi:hypothetical protein
MRTYFSELTSSNLPSGWNDLPPENSNEPTAYPSDVTLVAGYLITAITNDKKIYLMKDTSPTAVAICTVDDVYLVCYYTKPSIYGDGIYYFDPEDGNVKYATIDWAKFVAGEANYYKCVISIDTIGASGMAPFALYATSATVVVEVGIKNSGIGVSRWRYNAGWANNLWANAFMFPTKVMHLANAEQCYYSGAVSLGTTYNVDTTVYVTSPEDGSVVAVRYDAARSRWTDTWTAIQSDLSEFRVLKGLYYGGKALLLGQFVRTEELQHDPVAMLLVSNDGGKRYSVDQYSLLSRLGYRFMACISNNILYAGDLNRVGLATVGAEHGNTSAPHTHILTADVISFSADTASGSATGQLALRASDEVFASDTNIQKLNRCKVEVGYQCAASVEYTEYETYIISEITSVYADGERTFVLTLVQEGLWRLQTQTPPYYTEIFGKSGMKEDLQKLEHMTASGNAVVTETFLCLDFWGAEAYEVPDSTSIDIIDQGGVYFYKSPAGTHSLSFATADIMDKLACVDYPQITNLNLLINLRGTCRTVAAGDQNEDFAVYLLIDRNGVEMLLATVLNSTYSRFVKNYSGIDNNGNNPIVFDLSNNLFLIGDKIKRIVVVAYKTGGADEKHWVVERVDIVSGVSVSYQEGDWSNFEIVEATTGYLGGFKLPGYGRHIMLCDKPYNMFNGMTVSKWHIAEGSEPSPAGMYALGNVLLAEDANNCIIGRYVCMPADIDNYPRWEIVKVRDGIETRLAYSSQCDKEIDLHFAFIHNNQIFSIHKFTGSTMAETATLSYTWQVTDGPLATQSDVGILHPGIYAEKSTLNFRTPGFDSSKGKGIAILPGESQTVFDNFPESGKVVIDDHTYEYGGKSEHALAVGVLGPYQARDTLQLPQYVSDGVTYPAGVYAETALFSWLSNVAYSAAFAGYFLSTDNGSAWEIDTTDWKRYDADGVLPGDCSRHGFHVDEYSVSKSNRMYIGPALTAIGPLDDKTVTHGWGARCYLYGSEQIGCNYFIVFSMEADTTVKDMISYVARAAGATVSFSGDYILPSYSLTDGVEYELA